MKLLLATNNKHKVEEMSAIVSGIFSDLDLLTLGDISDTGLDVEESGLTLEENAFLKARAFYERTGIACVADDTGLEIISLNGAPGVHTARFAGENASFDDNINLTLERMSMVPVHERAAQFRCVICYCDDLRTVFTEGICKGAIATERRGSTGFGYDPIFIPDAYTQTFAELDSAEKNNISHRGLALQLFAEQFRRLML